MRLNEFIYASEVVVPPWALMQTSVLLMWCQRTVEVTSVAQDDESW